jgi:hypothetical protein
MMKQMMAVVLCCITYLDVMAQTAVNTLERVIGKNELTQQEIIANEIVFPTRIHATYFDTVSHAVNVQLRGLSKSGKWLNNTGEVLMYDLSEHKKKWSNKINYQYFGIKQQNDIIIKQQSNKSFLLNNQNGKQTHTFNNQFWIIEPTHKVGLGYKLNALSEVNNTLQGIDLLSGNVLWEREVNREFGWNNFLYLNDSTILIAAAGLHAIHINNGTGWDYHTVTGELDYTESAVVNTAGIALGLLTGTFVFSNSHKLVSDLVSNVLVDSHSIYFASSEKIVCINKSGQVDWFFTFPKNHASKSKIFTKDSVVYIINYGYAHKGNKPIKYGKAFIAAYEKRTGKQLFMKTVGSNTFIINDALTKSDTLYLIAHNSISKFSLHDGSKIVEKVFNTDSTGTLRFFLGDMLYTQTENTYVNLVRSDSTMQYVYTLNNEVLVLNNDLQPYKRIDVSELYMLYLTVDNYRFLANGNKSVVLDDDDAIIARLDISKRTERVGQKLYTIQEKSIVETDLKTIINK